MFIRLITGLIFIFLLSGCMGLFERADQAAAAKRQMVGLSREDILACMGPAKKKATEGTTEVWSYLSTNGYGSSGTDVFKVKGYTRFSGSHDKNFCTVNVVMKNGVVTRVNYNGPTSRSIFADDEQCGYAVANCVTEGTE